MADKKYVERKKEPSKKIKKRLMQKLLPAHFSFDHDEEWSLIGTDYSMVKLNVYRLKESSVGFYHSGVEFRNLEYTYCCGIGICYHKPKKCHFAALLGTVNLGNVDLDVKDFRSLLKEMDEVGGFSCEEYDVMDRSCNIFTQALAKKLGFEDRYPEALMQQSKMGEFLAPIIHALDIVAISSNSNAEISSLRRNSILAKPTNSISQIERSKSTMSIFKGTHSKKRGIFANIFHTWGHKRKNSDNSAEPYKIPSLDEDDS